MTAPIEHPTVDPTGVPETLCIGRFNLHNAGGLWVITFTNVRPKAPEMIDQGKVDLESVVVARIVTTLENLTALRDLITQVTTPTGGQSDTPPSSSGGSRLN